LGWRLEIKGEVLCPRDNEVVVLASFYEHEFGLLPSSLHAGDPPLLPPEDLEPPPITVLHIAFFITPCEAFMGIDPYWKLWQYLFNTRVTPGRGGQLFFDLATI
jgi:hypothetical protein